VKRLVPVIAASALAAMPSLAATQTLKECRIGQLVTDDRGQTGVIAGGRDERCVIKYKDGQTQEWEALSRLHATEPAKTGTAEAGPAPAAPEANTPSAPEGVVVLRPQVANRIDYRADPLGHVVLTAVVNGAPIRFLVDTGASLVCLTPDDAHAAGVKSDELVFNQTVQTGNGPAHAAIAVLREMRIDQLQVKNVQAAVIEKLPQSVIGMSFLTRLKGFEMRNGALTMTW
jgi:clan AA aspartic protease (TIGR02281 family)